MSRFALEGVKILDFSWSASPITAKYFADNGAEVIRVESGIAHRCAPVAPPWKDARPDIDGSQFFASFNTSKKASRSIRPATCARAGEKLVPWADIVAESFTPKAMRKWELDYEHLRQINPKLIMLSTCMQGQTGPNAMYPGFGQLMAALAGYYYISGYDKDSPCPPYGAYSDFIAPRFSAAALLAALDYRRRTGKGQYIDMSQYEAALHNLAPALTDYFASGRVVEPRGNASSRYAPHGAYRCADEDGHERWIAIAVADDTEWSALLRVLNGESSDSRFRTKTDRIANASALDEFVNSLTRSRDAVQLVPDLQAAGVAAYQVQNCMDLHQDENVEAFDFWHWLEHKTMGPSSYEGLQHRMSRTPGELRFAAPVLGQHNDEIFSGMLGLSAAEIEQLKKERVIF